VKLFGEFNRDEGCKIKREMEKVMNVMHPCIAAPFGFVRPTASKELRIAKLYNRSGSLKGVCSVHPPWWTPTATAVAGIVIGMKFWHSFRLIHVGLKPSNVLFDESHRIQIANFGQSRLDARESAAIERGVESELEAPEMWSAEERTVKVDVFSFALPFRDRGRFASSEKDNDIRKAWEAAGERVAIP
jgi:serine/threonine protein kinase